MRLDKSATRLLPAWCTVLCSCVFVCRVAAEKGLVEDCAVTDGAPRCKKTGACPLDKPRRWSVIFMEWNLSIPFRCRVPGVALGTLLLISFCFLHIDGDLTSGVGIEGCGHEVLLLHDYTLDVGLDIVLFHDFRWFWF